MIHLRISIWNDSGRQWVKQFNKKTVAEALSAAIIYLFRKLFLIEQKIIFKNKRKKIPYKRFSHSVSAMPLGAMVVNYQQLSKRFIFLELSPAEQRVMQKFCELFSRAPIAQCLCLSHSGVEKHFTSVKNKIGKINDDELHKILLCSHNDFKSLYFKGIEAYKKEQNINYVMKTLY